MKKRCLIILLGYLLSPFFIFANEQTSEQFYDDGCKNFKEGDYESSVVDFENAINLDKDYFVIMTGNGVFERLLKAGKKNMLISQEIVKICGHILQDEERKDFFVFLYLGWAQLNLMNKKESIKNLKVCLKKMKKNGLNTEVALKLLEEAKALNKKPENK